MKNKVIISIIVMFIIIIAIVIYLSKNKRISKTEDIQNASNVENSEEVNSKHAPDIFANYYEKAKEKLATLSLEEKIGQIFLVRYPETNQVEVMQKYKFGGYLFFEKDFKNKTADEVKEEIANLQNLATIPMFIAVDEEGGKIVRVSSNKNLSEERFKSPRELYQIGGFDEIKKDTKKKSELLYNLGINLNLAPVVDVSENPKDYIYSRTIGESTSLTAEFAKTVISASKEGKVSYTLKHFPGYGSNLDTHKGISQDDKSYEEILESDLPPFIAGIEEGAEAVMISHNIVKSIDEENPASLSKNMIKVLREELRFKGVIITDDLHMGAVSNDEDAVIKAVLAGNDLIIVTDYEKAFEKVKKAVEDRKIQEETINKMVENVLAWKYYKEMILF